MPYLPTIILVSAITIVGFLRKIGKVGIEGLRSLMKIAPEAQKTLAQDATTDRVGREF